MDRTDSIFIGLRAELDSELLDKLADALAPHLADRLQTDPDEDRWLTSKEAANYVGLTKAALYQYTASRLIPFEQTEHGGKCWFKRSELDRWRRGEWRQ